MGVGILNLPHRTDRRPSGRPLRRLAKEGRVIKATRGERYRDGLGDFYKVFVHQNMIEDAHIDLETLGRKLGVLKPYERLEEDPDA